MGRKPRTNKGKTRALAAAKVKPANEEPIEDVDIDVDEEEDDEEEELTLDEMLVESVAGVKIATVLGSWLSEKQVKLRLRISKPNKWKHMLTFLLREEKRVEGDWKLHACQHYLLYKDRLVYTWEFILQSEDLDNAVKDVCRMFDLIRSNLSLFEDQENRVMRPANNSRARAVANTVANRIYGELEEYPLLAPQDRNRPNSKGKGASFIGAGGM